MTIGKRSYHIDLFILSSYKFIFLTVIIVGIKDKLSSFVFEFQFCSYNKSLMARDGLYFSAFKFLSLNLHLDGYVLITILVDFKGISLLWV